MALTMTCSKAWAQGFVQIDDLASGPPIVTTDLAGNFQGTGNATVVTGNEEATITGYLPTPTLLSPLGTSRSVIFQEPTSSQPSDFVTLTIGDYNQSSNGFVQFVRIFFQSDGAANFATNVALLPSGTPTLHESDPPAFQNVAGALLLNSSPLDVYVRSGEETSVPEPVSLLFLGAGLVGMTAIKRKNRKEEL
jgi:hypothetical protein